MTTQNTERPVDRLVEQGRELVQKGNKRHVVIRNAEGKQIASVSLTVAVVVALAAVVLLPFWGIILLVIGGFIATGMKMKVELIREISDDDNVVQGQKTQNGA
jgi:hypothetical protein